MENILERGIPLMGLYPLLLYVDGLEPYKDNKPCLKIWTPILVVLIIIVLFCIYKSKIAGTEASSDDDDDNGHQEDIKSSDCQKDKNYVMSSLIITSEPQYNISVKLAARKPTESKKCCEESECHDQKPEDRENHIFNLTIQLKKNSCESKDQCGGLPKSDEENFRKDSFDDPCSSQHEINIALYSRIKIKDFEADVCFSTVKSHPPAEINKIPWGRLNKEWWRLHTFSKYPRNAPLSSILLARHGFVYIGSGNVDDDTIICVFCLSAAKDLEIHTDIEELHQTLNPSCPIVRGLNCQNIMIKEYDRNLISYILSQLTGFSMNKSPAPSGQQHEDQISSLEADSPEEPSHLSGSSTTNAVNDDVYNQASEAPAASRVNNNSLNDTSSHQATENNASYAFVTNRAQSLLIAGSDVIDGVSSNRTYEAQQVATSDARPDAVPDSVPSPASCSSKPNTDRPTSRPETGSASHNQTRNSDSSRPNTHSNTSNSQTSRPQETRGSSSNSQSHPENSSSPPQQTEADEAPPSNATSYDKLGIITARPKRPEYAVEIIRLNSFEGWPQDHHIKAEDLAKAGYFYTGYSDCARCFYCGGGLRNWEVGDDVWVEHARWFPKCAFMRQIMGQPFIDVVQDLNKEKEIIPYEDVVAEMKFRGLKHAIPKEIKDRSMDLERDAAVITIIDNGFNLDDTVMAAEKLRETGQSLSADVIYEELEKRKVSRKHAASKADDDSQSQSISKKRNGKKDQEMFETLRGENNQLRSQSQCKICMDKEVSVVFLPCGHFISCNDCSFALKSCPVCRDTIKGVVRAYLK